MAAGSERIPGHLGPAAMVREALEIGPPRALSARQRFAALVG